ncbi:MAG: hypothetical protein JXB39_09185 [Deltaproteobacteria bacterium]|nr:hypothetical protein [Deltaproteobacteria bacterium]
MNRPGNTRTSNRFWAHVAAFGALWGTVEITLGAFLHTLRVPLTGVLLAALGAGLLVAQRQVQPKRGTTLATGIVAALCKSVSPGGVILGPMAGISVEALLVEVGLFAAPRALLSAILAGGVAATWALAQKVVTQYVVYGADVVRLYLALLAETARALGMAEATGWAVLVGVAALVFVLGSAGGVLGWAVGRRAAAVLAVEPAAGPAVATASRLEDRAPPRYRGLMALLALACVALQFSGALLLATISLVVFLGALTVADRRALARLWMPRFWAFTLLVGLGAGLFLGKRAAGGVGLSLEGLRAGALMTVRGAFVFALASWGSRALRRRDLERALARVGLGRLGTAAATAFGLLPGLRDRVQVLLPRGSPWTRHARGLPGLAALLVVETARLADDLALAGDPPGGRLP